MSAFKVLNYEKVFIFKIIKLIKDLLNRKVYNNTDPYFNNFTESGVVLNYTEGLSCLISCLVLLILRSQIIYTSKLSKGAFHVQTIKAQRRYIYSVQFTEISL